MSLINSRLFRKSLMAALAVALAAVLVLATGGCLRSEPQRMPVKSSEQNKPDISAQPQETLAKVTLYFGDGEATYLVPEEREVAKETRPLEEVVIEELIKGPQNPDLTRTVPQEAKLLSVKVVDGVAYVNFSKEFQTKHWGGSAGELMTLYSITNSLAELPGIEKVQFLLEGETQEAILGHADTTQPIEPNWELVKE